VSASKVTHLENKPPPAKEQLLDLEGLTLLHFGLSNCSQRVRVCLFERGLNWRSLELDIMRNMHATPWYQSLNAKGVVPTLIHNGRIITESLRIIEYIDTLGTMPSLGPQNETQALELQRFLSAAESIQPAVKLLSHVYLFFPMRPAARRSFKQFEAHHRNQELLEFRRRFINKAFTQNEINEALTQVYACLNALDNSIASSNEDQWILGDTFSLADIAWVVNVHRFQLMGLPIQQFTSLQRWYTRICQRPSVVRGLLDFEPKVVVWLAKFIRTTRRPDWTAFSER